MKMVCSNILFVDKFVNSAFLIKKDCWQNDSSVANAKKKQNIRYS